MRSIIQMREGRVNNLRTSMENNQDKPEYFRLHEEEDRSHFKKLQAAIDKLPCKEDLIDAVKAAVEEHVNGKIKGVQTTLDKYIEDDMEWKTTANPAVSSYIKGSAFVSVITSFTQFFLPVAGLIGIIYGVIKWLK